MACVSDMNNIEYLKNLTKELFLLEKQGQDESWLADDIRDEMDEPWYALTDEERIEYNEFCKELYNLE